MTNLIVWKDDADGLSSLASSIPDGSSAEIEGGTSWTLKLNGRPIRGSAANLAACKESVWQEYVAYVMDKWMRGRGVPSSGGFLCPLK